ncbi:MAG: hypothetical protein O2948_10920 [Proteobacteria bacterium]|nr:hypothetical protein [Pseudomonadota bacterium]MDA0927480.1 hypothetical protein [Pseudomonadota bacterium]
MLRKSVFALAILLGSLASQVYALGLGTVTVESYLNQPLRVRIEILDLGNTRLQDVTVQMASVDDFARFNIDRTGFLSNVRFRVEETAGGNFVILSTNQVVRELYLSFILETRWPNGRLLSEHTIIMDLPVFDDQPGNSDSAQVRRPISPVLQPPVNNASPSNAVDQAFVDSTPSTPVAPSSSVAPILEPEIIAPEPEPAAPAAVEPEPVEEEPAQVQEPVPESAAAEVEEEAVAEEPALAEEVAIAAPAADEVMEEEQVTPQAAPEPAPIEVAAAPEPEEPVEPETITTSAADTLTSIAEQVRPDSSVSLQQTMLALQELNPDAFIDGNINRMRSGQVLRVPSREEIESIDAADAVAEVSRQNQAFTDVQPLAAPSSATPDQDQPGGQLSVVSADDAIDATAGGGGLDDEENAELDRRIAQLENQLALRQEEADRARIEREELDSRLADLEQQVAAAEELIRLQDLQLAQLQESIAQAAADAEAEAAAQAAIAAAQAEFEQQPQGGDLMNDIMRILTGNTMMMIFGVVLVVLLLVVLLLRRNKASGAREEDELDELAEQEFDAGTEAVAKPVKRVTAADSDSDDGSDFDQELDDILAAAGTGDEEEDDDEGDTSADDEGDELDGNPVAQAEILIAHEQYAQAADLLREAIAEGDNESALRMKLMDVLALDGNMEAFEAEAKIIADEKSPRLDRDVSQLREKYGIEAPAQKEDDELDTFAFGAEDDAKDSSSEPVPVETAAEDDEEETSFLDDLGIDLDSFDSHSDDIDLDFSDEMEEQDSKPATEAGKSAATDENKQADADLDIDGDDMDLTFDLGGDDEEAGEAEDKADDASDEIDSGSDDLVFEEDTAPAKEEVKAGQDEESEDLDLDVLLDLDDDGDKAELASGSSKDADDLEIESFEFDAGDMGGDSAQEQKKDAAKDKEDLDIETFSFDVDDLKPEAPKEPEPEVEIDADKLMDFDFGEDDKAEVRQADDAKPEGEAVDDIESFEFDIDESSSTTVIEPAEKAQKEGQAEAAAETTVDDFDFDLDELETGSPELEPKSADDDDDVLDLDSAFEGLEDKDTDTDSDDDVEIDFDAIDDDSVLPAAADDDDDLDFLADDDDDDGVEIESVDDVEEVDLLSDDEETATKLELAYAYQKMGDADGAREILQEVIAEGTDEQVKEARELMASIDSSEG